MTFFSSFFKEQLVIAMTIENLNLQEMKEAEQKMLHLAGKSAFTGVLTPFASGIIGSGLGFWF